MEKKIRIDQFLDDEGRIKQLPRKLTAKLAVLEHLTEKFEMGRFYSEREVNEICDLWHTFGDYFLIRRELVDCNLLARERDGSRYWRVWEKPDDDTE